MNTPLRAVEVDRLAALARAETPAPLRAGQPERMIDAAMAAAAARPVRKPRARLVAAAALAVAVAAVVIAAALLRGRGGGDGPAAATREVVEQPAQMTLPSGERLTATAGAVYVVKVSDGVTTVVVYEGTVRVIGGTATVEVKAGEAWVSAGAAVTAEPIREVPDVVAPSAPVPVKRPPMDLLGEADRLRAAGRVAEAARAYEVAAPRLRGDDAAIAGYQAAYLYARRLDDPDAALRALEASGADRAGAPLEERALVLRITILDGSGGDATAAIARYLDRFPDGDWANTLRTRAP